MMGWSSYIIGAAAGILVATNILVMVGAFWFGCKLSSSAKFSEEKQSKDEK